MASRKAAPIKADWRTVFRQSIARSLVIAAAAALGLFTLFLALALVTYDSTDKTDVYLSGSYNYINYEKVALYGNDGWRGNLGASYKPTDRIFVFVEGGYGLTDFIRSTPALGFIPTSHVYGGFVGVRGQFTERIEGTVGGGYEIRDFPDIPGASFSIPAANVSVS